MLHAGLTVWGKRNLGVCLAKPAEEAPGEWQWLPQQPGAFYIGNLCAPWHQVWHFAPAQAEPLFRRGDGNITFWLLGRLSKFKRPYFIKTS